SAARQRSEFAAKQIIAATVSTQVRKSEAGAGCGRGHAFLESPAFGVQHRSGRPRGGCGLDPPSATLRRRVAGSLEMKTPHPEGSQADESRGGPTGEEPTQQRPHLSTVGLTPSAPTAPASSGDDLLYLQVGELLAGRFSVVRFLARGGMGSVYEATDSLLRTQ